MKITIQPYASSYENASLVEDIKNKKLKIEILLEDFDMKFFKLFSVEEATAIKDQIDKSLNEIAKTVK
jgi:hypothetical protein